jgi:hypothetical protein
MSALILRFKAFRLSLTLGLSSGRRLAFVSQVPVSNNEKILASSYSYCGLTHLKTARSARSQVRCLFLEIHRWPRSLSSLVRASTRRYFFTVLRVDRSITINAMIL